LPEEFYLYKNSLKFMGAAAYCLEPPYGFEVGIALPPPFTGLITFLLKNKGVSDDYIAGYVT
jgi:hypothetical protein